jgi:hypothetical protein
MSDHVKDSRKRAPPASSSGESSTSTPKPDQKKAKPFDPQSEATPLGQRRSQAQILATSSSSSSNTLEPETPGPQPAEAANNDVFNPHDKTVGDISLDDSDDLFELAMTAENFDQAGALATTDVQRKRVWLAMKNKVSTAELLHIRTLTQILQRLFSSCLLAASLVFSLTLT